ncbi:MAG: bifunctional DNA-formamidopyrimidine glycosylase/DNA-(apurinic or apyrimidinic site) lyase [Alphaproteobacteria bacterium]|nr:bifunctional DNA-formamidopyrimidine glycosylase/DNA-(apurinic or apyrimidinic site) lyase [Alphaproteobacteria bacterium]
MPELPEVETVVRGLRPHLLAAPIARVEQRRPDLRFPFPARFAERLTGRSVTSLDRRAKYILATLDDGVRWLVHLGMSGRFTVDGPGARRASSGQSGRSDGWAVHDAHDHVVVVLADGAVLRFNDARRFGFMDLIEPSDLATHPRLIGLGPEPLEATFDARALESALAFKATPLKAALLDQKVVAGLGNIYVSEALFRAGLSPRRLACTVQGAKADRLCAAIKSVLSEAIEAGGSSLRDYVQATGELGYFQHRFAVYDREGQPCEGCTCRTGIQRLVQSGRSTFFCPKRQR